MLYVLCCEQSRGLLVAAVPSDSLLLKTRATSSYLCKLKHYMNLNMFN